MEVPRNRYCSPNVTIETASAIYIHLERLGEERHQFMFWKADGPSRLLGTFGKRIRDLRPGDQVEFNGKKRVIESVEIYR